MNKKSRAILKALAEGRSYEEILTSNRTLTSHDIFHTLSETPTSHWRKKLASKKEPGRNVN